ncbi:neuronal tyrosine-phosphorylated phosphoinositide-3-kinase adapter 2-like isoform X2 [Corythoichthys intestinalis]|uniref:neuronal tyrosine-phosphorylated phosphoinositide-3-kinase adapter 2-like isoform X2 n=1 Tax=Corythoichthys intestinalis TaxID=161448 RepID=UPI0025A64ABF|nr:neuronal tyrosine-phosphorylated phosphoinositide-3-kinase adapter 2-like isoform X2 [Corythoichthys intestinalis]
MTGDAVRLPWFQPSPVAVRFQRGAPVVSELLGDPSPNPIREGKEPGPKGEGREETSLQEGWRKSDSSGRMTSQEEASTLRRFFQYVEDSCLRAYDQLVIQNAWDISRESDRLRNRPSSREMKIHKKRQGEAIKRTEDEEETAAGAGKYFRMGLAPGRALGVRSQSLTSVGDGADERKQPPPPKPKRDPNTKLSSSSEALPTQTQEPQHAHPACGEDWKKTPPPKPKRDPNTQLSSSRAAPDDPESVYIEMAANVPAKSPEEQSESVYEEMKFPERRVPPQPFPNLLTPRPPLLVFPPAPPQRSPDSDESPLTPVDVAQLSAAGKKAAERESSGRSSAPPLRSAPARTGSAYPRSRSACPSPVARSPAPTGQKRPPPYEASVAGRLAGAGSPDAADWRSRRDAQETKCLCQLGRSSSTPGAPTSQRDHPALGQMPWLCGDATMMETMEKKRILCREIQSRRRAGGDDEPAGPRGRSKRPPPYSAPPIRAVWDTAI